MNCLLRLRSRARSPITKQFLIVIVTIPVLARTRTRYHRNQHNNHHTNTDTVSRYHRYHNNNNNHNVSPDANRVRRHLVFRLPPGQASTFLHA